MYENNSTSMNFPEMFELVQEVNRYFKKRTRSIYITHYGLLESFEEYLNHRYKDNCYYYSFYALMGLKSKDYLVRGNIDINQNGYCNYHHGWVEFNFKGNNYIFDSLIIGITTKQEWYKTFKPKIDYKKTQEEILDEYLNEKYAFKVNNTFWQFKESRYFVDTNKEPDSIDFREFEKYDKEHGCVPSALTLSRLVISDFSKEILSFIK